MAKRNPPGNHDGETEACGAVMVTHHFRDAPGAIIPIRWHYIKAGLAGRETIVFLHGNPESWHSWHPQIAHFGARYHIIAPDLKGYGQGDKRPGDWRWENCAEEMLALADRRMYLDKQAADGPATIDISAALETRRYRQALAV